MENWQHKSEKERLITERDALKIDLEIGTLSNKERIEAAQEIDKINDKINEKQ